MRGIPEAPKNDPKYVALSAVSPVTVDHQSLRFALTFWHPVKKCRRQDVKEENQVSSHIFSLRPFKSFA